MSNLQTLSSVPNGGEGAGDRGAGGTNFRNDCDWQPVEACFRQHLDLRFTHGIGPRCVAESMALLEREEGPPDTAPPGAPGATGAS